MLPVFLLTTYFVFVCLEKTENNQNNPSKVFFYWNYLKKENCLFRLRQCKKLKYKECQINIGKVKNCMINYQ